jgi:hypothetical protein
MKSRPDFAKRTFLLRDEEIRERFIAAVRNAPLDAEHPLEAILREEVKARKSDQNSLYWAGPLRDIAEQAWIEGRQYSADVLHEHFKREYLPEEYDPEDCKEGYEKWSYTPGGERVLVGSTKSLTVHGFAKYLTQVEAFGASLGVQFHTRESRR